MDSGPNLLFEIHDSLCTLTLNRVEKRNAFDDHLIQELQSRFDQAISNTKVRAILLKANGKHFSAGADLNWMQKMATFSEEENRQDAVHLARLLFTLYKSPKPVIARVQGSAFGGGAGLVAACDIAIASTRARFCFSEVSLGLIPAVISPYVIKAIGAKAARWLFISAETIDAMQAKQLGLVQHCFADDELDDYILNYADKIISLAPKAISECKTLIDHVGDHPIDKEILEYTAMLLAKKRVSTEGRLGLQAFLNKEKPQWN